jgi:hypothetical protein
MVGSVVVAAVSERTSIVIISIIGRYNASSPRGISRESTPNASIVYVEVPFAHIVYGSVEIT